MALLLAMETQDGAIFLRTIIGFLTLIGEEGPLMLDLRTILPHMVHKLRVL